jgi:hypothetical protein
MTEGGFVSGSTMVHERPVAMERRVAFTNAVRAHLAVLGPVTLLEKLSAAHRHAPHRDALVAAGQFTPTEVLFVDFAESHPNGWAAVLRLVADVIADAQAASRA